MGKTISQIQKDVDDWAQQFENHILVHFQWSLR